MRWCIAAACPRISTTGATSGTCGWGWDDVRPYFEKSERRVAPDGHALTDGPLDVKDVTPFLHPMRAQWLEAAAELGLPVTDDFNGAQPGGTSAATRSRSATAGAGRPRTPFCAPLCGAAM